MSGSDSGVDKSFHQLMTQAPEYVSDNMFTDDLHCESISKCICLHCAPNVELFTLILHSSKLYAKFKMCRGFSFRGGNREEKGGYRSRSKGAGGRGSKKTISGMGPSMFFMFYKC